MRSEEALELGHDRLEVSRLRAGGRQHRVGMHRVAHPGNRNLGPAHRFEERWERLANALGTHAHDEREPARNPDRG
jgi:hypothetical protein